MASNGRNWHNADQQVQKPNPNRSDWVKVDVPPIISDPDLFARVQARLEQNRTGNRGRKAKHEYLLSRRLRCGDCNGAMKSKPSNNSKRYRYYVCALRDSGRRGDCKNSSFSGPQIDDLVWNWLLQNLKRPELITSSLREQQSLNEQVRGKLDDQVALVDGLLEDIKVQQGRLIDLALTQQLDSELFSDKNLLLAEKRRGLETARAEMVKRLSVTNYQEEQLLQLESYCIEVALGLDQATFDDKKRYLELLDVRGTLAVENSEKVVYLTCLISSQRLVLIPTSRSSSIGETGITVCACRRTAPSP